MVKDLSNKDDLRVDLVRLGLLATDKTDAESIKLAVKSFQKQLGVKDDGIAGPVTAYGLHNARINDYNIDERTKAAAQKFEQVFYPGHKGELAQAQADAVISGGEVKAETSMPKPVMNRFNVYGDTKLGKGELKDPSWLERSIMHMEGFNKNPRPDRGGYYDIGHGVPAQYAPKGKVSKDEAYGLMQEQIARKVGNLDKIGLGDAFRKMAPHQQDALMGLVYNIDVDKQGFKGSQLFHAIEKEDHKEIGHLMRQYNKITVDGKKVFDKGLDWRRQYDMAVFEGNVEFAFHGDPDKKPKFWQKSREFNGLENWKNLSGDDKKAMAEAEKYYKETMTSAKHAALENLPGTPATKLPDLRVTVTSKDLDVGP